MTGEYIDRRDVAEDTGDALIAAVAQVAIEAGLDPDKVTEWAVVIRQADSQMAFQSNLIDQLPLVAQFLGYAATNLARRVWEQQLADMVPDDLSGLDDKAA